MLTRPKIIGVTQYYQIKVALLVYHLFSAIFEYRRKELVNAINIKGLR